MDSPEVTPPLASMVGRTGHVPVLFSSVLESLAVDGARRDLTYVDATLGAGGHASAIVSALSPKGLLLGLDRDKPVLEATQAWLQGQLQQLPSPARLQTCHTPFGDVAHWAKNLPGGVITGGILADIGVSSMQLDQAERGFGFKHSAPLDMRMDASTGPTAAALLAETDEATLAQWFWEYGEERKSRHIAQKIVALRTHTPITTTSQLAEVVKSVVAKGASPNQHFRIHPARRVFQALRIVVNDELGQLNSLLSGLPSVLAPGARVAIISFHSLEDRMVKRAFAHWKQEGWGQPLSKKPIEATDAEVAANPRSRSAKLRVFCWSET